MGRRQQRRLLAFAQATHALEGLVRRAGLADHAGDEGAAGPAVALERTSDGDELAMRAGFRVGPGSGLAAVLGAQRGAERRLGQSPVARVISRRERRRRALGLIAPIGSSSMNPGSGMETEQPASASPAAAKARAAERATHGRGRHFASRSLGSRSIIKTRAICPCLEHIHLECVKFE